MGWYGETTTICPNCKTKNASDIYRNNMLDTYYLICTDCGLHLYAERRSWIVTNSYIDNSIIDKNREDLNPEDIVDHERNDDIIPKGTAL